MKKLILILLIISMTTPIFAKVIKQDVQQDSSAYVSRKEVIDYYAYARRRLERIAERDLLQKVASISEAHGHFVNK